MASLFLLAALAPERLAGLGLLAAAGVLTWLAGAYICRQVAGLTGDSYGALGELVTAVGFVVLTVAWR